MLLDRKNFDFTALEVTFTKSNVVLPTVIGLRIQCPGDWYFLVKICPNTERLILRDNLNCQTMMAVVGSLQKLQHLELFDKCWNEDDIDKLCNLVPNIESLSLKGNILVGSSNVEVSNHLWLMIKMIAKTTLGVGRGIRTISSSSVALHVLSLQFQAN